MFAKLLKHEIKSTGGLLGILSGAALAVGVVGGFLLRSSMNTSVAGNTNELLSVVSSVATPFIFLSLFAYAFGGLIYLAVQFYKRKFTDQGYLTFTLPVRAWQIYLSSLLNMMLWTLVICVVTILAFACTYLIGIYDTEVWHMMMDMGIDVSVEAESLFPEYGIWNIVNPIVSFISGNVLLITSITLGCVVAKKHKVLGSIGCYYLISLLINSVSTYLGFEYDASVEMTYMISSALYAVVILLGSWLSIRLMDKKLNLP